MSQPDQSCVDLTARLSQLERRQRVLPPLAVVGLMLTLAFVVAFAAEDPDIVKAQRIELVDLKGNTQAALVGDSTGIILTLLDKKGHARASLRLNDDPRLTVRDAAGREVAALGAMRVQHLVQ